ncbi:uncharacterized protein LOC132171573 [Corylus avellana]|uniref:uncharacterized protein LOC132171573 n=1 Tax=Corylus avellana TaxID=13451 RepID=UPI00286B7EF9|nr:uncharacterized protein LOC132171573 [Corylus avellana]
MNDDHVNEAIIKATKGGLLEFIKEIFEVDAQLLVLIHKLDAKKSITNARDQSGSTILHMAAMLEPSTTRDRIAGEALKMQSELRWFKMQEVETHCFPWINEIRNNRNMTPKELFTHNHKDMREKEEKWMKATVTSCTVVGALIITIMFNAAFTLPGSNNKDIGFPMFPQKKLLMAFIISDALSLVSSSTSVLVFLLILTSRYAQEDFHLSLPIKMILGLFTLFFSIATIMVSFCVGLFIMLPGKLCIVIPVTVLAGVTVIGFGFMQIPLLVDMLKSTVKVWSALYGRKRKHLS